MKLRMPASEDVGFQMAPMIDCVFQLMIFFMCASHIHFTADAPQIEIPVASNSSIADDMSNRRYVTIRINKPEEVATLGEQSILIGGTVVTLAQLRDQISKAAKDNANLRVFLRADKRLKHKTVRETMQTIAEAGVADIIFAAWQSEAM
jgi:biopolymer transport protein ExbD